MLRIPHCLALDYRFIDGGKVVSPTYWPRSTLQRHFSVSGAHFCERLSEPQGLLRPEGLCKLKTFIHLGGSRTCELPSCSDHFLKCHNLVFEVDSDEYMIYF
jgi:hypothetical protein